MATVNEILTRSLRLLQVLEAGEAPSAEEAQDALETINNLIDSWANESLMLYARVEHSISFVSGQTQYTIGSAGSFNVTRPVGIMNAFVRDGSTDWPIEEINNDQYQRISIKSTAATYPSYFYYRPDYPLGVIDVWPAPGAGLTFFINVKDQFTAFPAVSTTVALPPGYVRALEYNLAVEIAPEYVKNTSAANVQFIQQKATESKEFIKNTNDKNIPVLSSPAAYLGGNNNGYYDWWPF